MEQYIYQIAMGVVLFVGGIAMHAWFTRQKSNILRVDAIKAAADLLVSVATSSDNDKIIQAAMERKQVEALAVAQALQKLSVLTQPKQ